MKARFWGVIAVVLALALLAGFVDWLASPSRLELQSPAFSASRLSAEPPLVACASPQGSYVGSLVPGQGTPVPGASLSAVEPAGAIPSSAWSARAGFSISSSTDPTYWATALGSGWYLDWAMRADLPAGAPQHWQMVRVHAGCITPAPQAIQANAQSFPGQVWIIGNEPDVIWQDDVTPARYAEAYHALYQLIKASDPTASIAVGGVAQATPLRLQYLDQVLAVYQQRYHAPLPADWWTVHGYVLREEQGSWGAEIPPGLEATQGMLYEVSDHARLDLFESQLLAFRVWMKAHGYQHTPLALTEFGILMPTSYGFPDELIADYLAQTFTWLYQARDISIGDPADDYHLVQKWAWFSISDPNYPSSNLGDLSTGSLSLVGERFRAVVLAKGQ